MTHMSCEKKVFKHLHRLIIFNSNSISSSDVIIMTRAQKGFCNAWLLFLQRNVSNNLRPGGALISEKKYCKHYCTME